MAKTNFIDQLVKGFSGFETFVKMYLARKVETTFQVENFTPTEANLAKIHNCSLEEIDSTLNYLESLGLIRWNKSLPEANQTHIDFTNAIQNSPKSDQVASHRIFTHQLLNDIDVDERYAFRNGFFASDEETFLDFHNKFLKLAAEFKENSAKSKRNRVYGYSYTLASVTKEQK